MSETKFTVPKVSVIVPVYNVEKYLEKCLDSIVNQSMEEIEVILVNDGSTDRCPEICDKYAQMDLRVSVIHKNNGGLSDARNNGMHRAIGEYVLFVDSDDYIDLQSCEYLYAKAKEKDADVVIGDAIKVTEEKKIDIVHAKTSLEILTTGQEFLKDQLKNKTINMAVWLNFYRREFLINNKLTFKEEIYHEDEQWTPRVFLQAKKVIYIEYKFYFYVIRKNSITKSKTRTKNGIDIINTCYELESIFKSVEDIELRRLLNDYLVMIFLHAIHMGNLYNEEKRIYTKKFLFGKPVSTENKIKSALFIWNKHIYKFINRALKGWN